MNRLIELYQEMSNTPQLFKTYTSIASNESGKVFSFIDTNNRAILKSAPSAPYKYGGFAKGFSVIEDVEGKPRAEWNRSNNAGQEVEKQHTMRMKRAEFFYVKDNVYKKTSRGQVFKKMLEDETLEHNEKLFLCYLLILPAYFEETNNYIFSQTINFFKQLENQGVAEEILLKSMFEIIKRNPEEKRDDIFNYDYTYFDTFYINKADFIENFINATGTEKKEFKQYIVDSASELTGTSANNPKHHIISKKYVNGGNYTPTTLTENAWILYLSKILINNSKKFINFDSFIDYSIKVFNQIFEVSEPALKTFIYNPDLNKSVFCIIYYRLFNIPIPIYEDEKDLTPQEIEELGKIDQTDETGAINAELVSLSLKKVARTKAGYKCECENLENCKYFTSRETDNNYLEIHHFIPREFSNDFDNSIEVVDNYIALCPNCHRKIHLAVDRERKHLIQLLFNKRKNALKSRGLDIELENILSYYKVSE